MISLMNNLKGCQRLPYEGSVEIINKWYDEPILSHFTSRTEEHGQD